jgi:protein-S-isoprenylcysteine O-methyltransferase Ste14
MTRIGPCQEGEDGVMFPRLVPLAVGMVGLALFLQWIVPIEIMLDIAFIEDIDSDELAMFGAVVATVGFALSLAGHSALRRRGADVGPTQAVPVLVTDGVFAWTRNPIYLGAWIAMSGIGVAFTFDWLLVLMAPFSVMVHFAAVKPEECYLQHKFGNAYQSYRRRVPRYFFIH